MAMIVIGAVAVAAEVSMTIYNLLNRPKMRPPVQDLQISNATEGAPIPFGYGLGRIAGNLIWTPGLRYQIKTIGGSIFGGGVKTYIYYADFAFAWCEGPAEVMRIWGDSKLIWTSASAVAEYPPEDFPEWDPTVLYNIGDIVSYQDLVWQATNESTNVAPGTLDPITSLADWQQLGSTPAWSSTTQYNPGDVVTYGGEIYVALLENLDVNPLSSHGPNGDWNELNNYYPPPTIYPGDEFQEPDPTIQANEGAANTPANRGICYGVFENFPLANFGNRIPSIRAEVRIKQADSKDIIDQTELPVSSPLGVPTTGFLRNNVAGDYLIAFSRTRPGGCVAGGWDPGNISDTAGNTWNLVGSGNSSYCWWARAVDYDGDVVTFASLSGTGFPYDNDNYLISLGTIYREWADPHQYAGLYAVGTIVEYNNHLYQALTNIAGSGNQGAPASWVRSSTIPPDAPSLWEPILDNFDATFSSGFASGSSAGPATVTAGSYSVSFTVSAAFPWTAYLFVLATGDSSAPPKQILILNREDCSGIGGPGFSFTVPDGWVKVFPDYDGVGSIVLTQSNDTLLADVVSDVTLRAGLDSSDIDVSLLTAANVQPTNVVEGYIITRPTRAAEIIKVLMQAYFFDGCESSGVLRFVPRGLPAVLTIPEGELGLINDKAEVKPEEIGQELDLPQSVQIQFNDLGLDFQQGKQQKERSTRAIQTKQEMIVQMPLTMDDVWAREVAEKMLWTQWIERLAYTFNLWRAYYLLLDPTDVIDFDYDSQVVNARITETTIGQGLTSALKALRESASAYESDVQGGGNLGFTPQPAPLIAPTLLMLFDVPLLRDSDSNPGGTGYYVMLSSALPGWPGAELYRSLDDSSFTPVDSSGSPVSYGFTTNALQNPASPFDWDNVNTLTVKMSVGSLASDTMANVLAGSNMLLVGNLTNGFEVLQFTTAVLNSDGTYTLSGLLRGRRGTEWMCGFWGDFSNGLLTHAVGDRVVVVDPAEMLHEDDNLSTLNLLYYYRGVTDGQDVSTAPDVDFTNTGNDLRPYAPVKVGGFFDGSGNLIMTWNRRTRIGGDGWGNTSTGQLPLSEDSELYDVEVLSGSTVKRTVSGLTTPTMVYTVAMMTADFGSPPASVTVNVYQISAQVGRGFKGHGVAPSATYAPETLPPSGDFYVNAA